MTCSRVRLFLRGTGFFRATSTSPHGMPSRLAGGTLVIISCWSVRVQRASAQAPVQACHQVELPLLALRRPQEHLLVQPGDGTEVEARGPLGEEAQEELLEELLEQHLQPLVVVLRQRFRHGSAPSGWRGSSSRKRASSSTTPDQSPGHSAESVPEELLSPAGAPRNHFFSPDGRTGRFGGLVKSRPSFCCWAKCTNSQWSAKRRW